MGENHNHCVLQWAGHAGYVAERFSGLLARQALVDVTLICEEQKLRVHKLVLASNSMYFEEILQEDLGQEPIILLRDLNFEILKAMVEFMYCGETTISRENLPSLLTASKVFKVKELAYIIDTIMESENYSSDIENVAQIQEIDNDLNYTNNNFKKHCCPRMKDDKEIICNVPSFENSKSDTMTMKNQYEEGNISIHNSNNTFKHRLYEDSYDTEDLNVSEQCSASLPQTCAQEVKLDVAQNIVDNVPRTKMRKCIKVYTHKKRKPATNIRNELMHISNTLPKSSSTNSIDLLDVPSGNDMPVTLLTPLDMECAEYLFSLDNENMQSVAESLMNEQRSLMKCKDINECINRKACNDYALDIHKSSINEKDNSNLQTINDKAQEMERPVLRRSVRLNQQESEDSTNTSISVQQPVLTEKLLEKASYPSRTESFTKGKRKIKETTRKSTDQNVINIARFNKKCFNNMRAHRNTSKTVVKKNIKSASAESHTKEKSDQKAKANNRVKCEMRENIDTVKISMGSPLHKNTIGYISRALWGDMSDIIEHNNDIMDLAEYSPNGEIPFAVGLLPLRTALEKMQAMPDYQPRKTRSSVAPVKQEINYLKRKNCSLEPTAFAKKQNVGTIDQSDKTNTVCHIQIRAAPSQYIKSRKKFLTEHVTNLESATIVNRQ
ncbi:hypothetical protein KPH14_004100 [Odynerus spinipes]|uniref:BTB domain-containing protein n=1 Tax=Odynerus spinipes TaxID=1348599 RepID=A0AAD9RY31_9HYME|nr:hypothetical protein KPH14_004100 [Odynerus spinipes]